VSCLRRTDKSHHHGCGDKEFRTIVIHRTFLFYVQLPTSPISRVTGGLYTGEATAHEHKPTKSLLHIDTGGLKRLMVFKDAHVFMRASPHPWRQT
jgi:hypothetical protein